jgi:hypothetical protein
MRITRHNQQRQHRSRGADAPQVDEPANLAPAFDTTRFPIEAHTGRAIPPRAQPGYYPGHDVLAQRAFWDEATRKVVMQRVEDPPPIRFFADIGRVDLARAVFDRILPQDDRDATHRIPIVNFVDQKLYNRQMPGYRFADMPDDQEAYKLGFQGIEAIAEHLYGTSFVALEPLGQDRILTTLHDANPPAGQEFWKRLSIRHFWMLLVEHAAEAYYAHPYAWNEIGYGGPAYPRGYMRLEQGKPEPWEADERRYAWDPPPTSLSGEYTPVGGKSPLDEQLHGNVPSPTGAGTH